MVARLMVQSVVTPPLVTVVIPTFNYASWVVEAIESVRVQTIADFEVMVVDDGSTDDTALRVGALVAADHRLHYYQQANQGLSAARNTGIAKARGKYIAFLDADDKWKPRKLELQLALFARCAEVDVVYAGFAFMDEQGQLLDVE